MPWPRTLAALLLVSCHGSEVEPTASATPAPREIVRLSLLAERSQVEPGGEVELAARFEIAPGWHIYWTNPGDSGLPTKATFAAPPGFALGDVVYPGPASFRSPGGVVTYGYTGEAVLFARAQAPAAPAGDSSSFSVSASWLACRENCVRGKATASVSLPPAGAADQRAHAAILDRQRARVPRPWAELGVKPSWAYDAGEMRLDLDVPGASAIELFPLDGTGSVLRAQSVEQKEGRAVLHVRFAPVDPGHAPLRGALRVVRGAKIVYYSLDFPWPC